MLRLKNISKQYVIGDKEVCALNYISLDFRENVGYLNSKNIGGTLSPLEHNYYNGIENLYVRKIK